MNFKRIKITIGIIISIPFLMLLAWVLSPKQELVVAIIDKTVLNKQGQEHISLNWILNQNKYTKNKREGYQIARDYFGFFPKEDEKFRIRGLERFTSTQLVKLSEDADLAYFTDTYGIYNKEWYQQKNDHRTSGILYGGLSNQDLTLLKLMKAKNKLIITEFNTIGSPTSSEIRHQFETMFGMKWSGWTARYFNSLDTNINKELPVWMVKNYQAAHKKRWPFKKSGIVFVSDSDQMVILEDSTHMHQSMPYIMTDSYGQKNLDLPEKMKYPFWFDIIVPNKQMNKVVSKFQLDLKPSGQAELKKFGIPSSFPAAIQQNTKHPKFYYFSGDFCDNPISLKTSYFKGIGFFKFLFYNTEDSIPVMERTHYFSL